MKHVRPPDAVDLDVADCRRPRELVRAKKRGVDHAGRLALQLVSEEAAKLLVDEHDFSIEDAFIFLSVACDAGVAQACKPAEGFGTIARFSIPRIAACPGAFRA